MRLTPDVELVDGLPIAYIKSLNALAMSDLHLGYEGMMAGRGVLIPKINLKRILEATDAALKKTKAKRIIVNGDIKNEFSRVDIEEFNELYDFIAFARERKVELTLIKGNHDNFVERYREPFNLSVHAHQALIGDYLFFHGEILPKEMPKCRMAIMGHEHPSMLVYGRAGRREHLKCFLYGSYRRRPLLVLAAASYFASGNDLNAVNPRPLSPIFRKVQLSGMRAIICAYGSTLDFGPVGKLREIDLRSSYQRQRVYHYQDQDDPCKRSHKPLALSCS